MDSGRVSDATDPRVRAIAREILGDKRPPQDKVPWDLDKEIALLKSYCVDPGAWLSHNVRFRGVVTHDKLIPIASEFGNTDSWRAYWARVRRWVREVTTKDTSDEVVVIVEDRCLGD